MQVRSYITILVGVTPLKMIVLEEYHVGIYLLLSQSNI
jgi:hypothetical protein